MKAITSLLVVLMVLSIVPLAAADTVTIRPDGQGYYTQWYNTRCGYGSSEWQCVDEDPASTSDYLRMPFKKRSESFTFGDTGLTDETIDSVTLYYYAKWYRSSRYKIQPLIRSGGNDYLGPVKNLGSSYAYVSETYTTNPATGSAWTVAEVDALEAGMKSYTSSYGGYVAQVYAEVDYTAEIADSCSDTDGGNVIDVFGTVSGYLNETPYSDDDYCVDASNIFEYFCVGDYKSSQQQSCGTDFYGSEYCNGNVVYKDFTDYFCGSGECDSTVTPELQQDCDDFDGYVGDKYCMNGSVFQDYRDYSCSSGACTYSEYPDMIEYCEYGCENGECVTVPDSCSDTDGGNVIDVFGTVSGFFNNAPYSDDDYCVDSKNIFEYFCVGDQKSSQQQSCGTDGYGLPYCNGNVVYKDYNIYTCGSGECDTNSTPIPQQDCDDFDGYSSGYCVGDLAYKDYVDHYCDGGGCDYTLTPELQEDCNDYDGYGSNYCVGDSVYKDYLDYYCDAGGCNFSATPELVEDCDYGCDSGACNPPPVTYFSDDVESGTNGFSSTGLWHITERRSSSATHSWWYGNESTGTYETSGGGPNATTNSGDLISPSIDLTSATSPELTFQTYWDTELGTTYDVKKVFVSTNGGQSWSEVLQVSNSNSVAKTWQELSVDLTSFAGNTVKIKFFFDTIDGIANNYEGWFVDDIVVKE